MSEPPVEFYTEERWGNWLDRLEETDIDLEDEDSARFLWNLQDDAAIAVAKIVSAYDEGDIDRETALEEVANVRGIVLSAVDIDDEDKARLLGGVQTSLECVLYAAEEYVRGGPADEAAVEEYIRAASDAEAEDDLDAALGYCAQAGTLIIDGRELDPAVADYLDDLGLVAEWVNGLYSLYAAMREPEVVEADEE